MPWWLCSSFWEHKLHCARRTDDNGSFWCHRSRQAQGDGGMTNLAPNVFSFSSAAQMANNGVVASWLHMSKAIDKTCMLAYLFHTEMRPLSFFFKLAVFPLQKINNQEMGGYFWLALGFTTMLQNRVCFNHFEFFCGNQMHLGLVLIDMFITPGQYRVISVF